MHDVVLKVNTILLTIHVNEHFSLTSFPEKY